MKLFLELNLDQSNMGKLHQGNNAIFRSFQIEGLNKQSSVEIMENQFSLKDLSEALLTYDVSKLDFFLEERGQLEIGQYLYRQIFPDLQQSSLKANDQHIDLRIITDDEFIAGLPWVLLAERGNFLTNVGWSISLSHSPHLTNVTLPTYPKMLIIIPEPSDWNDTDSSKHVEELEFELSKYNHRLSLRDHIQVVSTWKQFCQQSDQFQPDLIYFYGHGQGNRHQSRLLFTNQSGDSVKKSMLDFAQVLRALDSPPKLVYLNCCSGDAGGFLGAGRQLREFIPAVITNRTVTDTLTAQSQAQELWHSILVDGQPPHVAMTQIRSKAPQLDLSYQDWRWLTPVLHCQYDTWSYSPPKGGNKLRDPYWHLKLDRVSQFGTVATQTRQMLRERRPRSLLYIWYGQPGQGIDLFHKRLKIELRKDLPANVHFLEVTPGWPMEYYNPERSFADMMCELFRVENLAAIPAQIRAETHGTSGRQTLLYVRHQPVDSKYTLNPAQLKQYLIWWDNVFMPLLENRVYALLTVSFEVNNPLKFYRVLMEKERVYDLQLERTIVHILDEMERIGIKDLYDFLQEHEVRLPLRHKDKILQNILAKTNGHYEMTINELRRLVSHELDIIDREESPQNDDDLYDY